MSSILQQSMSFILSFWFYGWLVTFGGMKRWGLRATFLSSYTELDAGQNARVNT